MSLSPAGIKRIEGFDMSVLRLLPRVPGLLALLGSPSAANRLLPRCSMEPRLSGSLGVSKQRSKSEEWKEMRVRATSRSRSLTKSRQLSLLLAVAALWALLPEPNLAAGLVQQQEIEPPGDFCDDREWGGFGDVLAMGDLDGDGLDDLIVGRSGVVYVYYSEGTHFSSPSQIAISAQSVATIDVNGDGFDDLIIVGRRTVWAFHGAPERLPASFNDFDADWSYTGDNDFFTFSSVATGWKLAAPVDHWGDGVDDLVLGSPAEGKAFVFTGHLGTGLWAAPSGGSTVGEGTFVLNAGPAIRILGRAVMYNIAGLLGVAVGRGPTEPDQMWEHHVVGVPGASVDLDYDGVFEAHEADAGGVKVGGFQLLAGDIVPGANFGYELGDAGDVNNDGNRDLVVSARRKDDTAPKVFVYLGLTEDDPFGPNTSDYVWAVEEPEQRILAGQPNPEFDTFGRSVGGAGDINGDGYGDIFIGDPRYDAKGQNRDQQEVGWWGRGLIWFGGPSTSGDPSGLGINPTPQTADIVLEGGNRSGEFGQTFASGDINGDGVSDLVVGDPRGAVSCIDERLECSLPSPPMSCSREGDWCYGGGTCHWVSFPRVVEMGLVWPHLSDFAPPLSCGDGIDNDGDGLIDLADPGCADALDGSEKDGTGTYPCDDGIDNDGDGGIDFDPVTFASPGDRYTPPAGVGDPGCHDPSWGTENPQCQDGIHNDSDGKMDYDAGFSANGSAHAAGRDPECAGKPWKNRECGLGVELVVVLPMLAWAHRRRGRCRYRGPQRAGGNGC
jgi:hypothetical protein